MKTVLQVLKIWIGVWIGQYAGRWLWLYLDVRRNPGLYELYSAPWYAQMVPYTMMSAAVLAVSLAAYFLLHRAIKKRDNQ